MALAEAVAHPDRFPHIVLELEGRLFTSLALFWRKQS
jgi:hypothetical protein